MGRRSISGRIIGYLDNTGTKFGALKEQQHRIGLKIFLSPTLKYGTEAQ
jgi:hypothetical protein